MAGAVAYVADLPSDNPWHQGSRSPREGALLPLIDAEPYRAFCFPMGSAPVRAPNNCNATAQW